MVGDYRGNYSRRSSDESDDASSVEPATTSSLCSVGKEYMTTEWTDEKHSLYLKSMEASFVNQLYNSLGNKDNVPLSRISGSSRRPSQEQFKVLHDGLWQKINVKEPEYQFSTRQGSSNEFLSSPWIKHYKSLPKKQVLVTDESCPELRNQVVSSLNGTNGYSFGSASSLIGQEVSDQNFVNEVTKDENESLKETKTVMSESPSTDQVVPLRKTHAT